MIFSKLNPRLVLASPGTFKLLKQSSLLVKQQPQKFKYLLAHNPTKSSCQQQSPQYWNFKHFALLIAAAASATLFSVAKLVTENELLAKEDGQQQKDEPLEKGKEKLLVITPRQKLFFQFASVEYEGMPYMTPQDFLESVTEDHPRRTMIT